MKSEITLEMVQAHLAIDPFFDEEPCWIAETNSSITAFYQRHPQLVIQAAAEETLVRFQQMLRDTTR